MRVLLAVALLALDAAGGARVVNAQGESVERGNARDAFTIALPTGAECQGDSMDGGYRVESFLLPTRFAPGDMKWGELAPTAKGSWALYDTLTNPYVHKLTAVATDQGGPGAIANVPLFSFEPFLEAPELLASGRYHVGLACSLFEDTTRYWSTSMRIDVDRSAAGADVISWRVLDAVPATGDSSPLRLLVPLGLVAGLGVVVAGRRRSTSRRHVATVALLVLACASLVVATVRPAAAGMGATAMIVDPDSGVEIAEGTRTTKFTLGLPTGAACAGDSANDGYRVQSFQVPSTVDPAALRFEELGPKPVGLGAAFRQPLYAINANPFVHAQTAPATPAPGPGTVVNLPAFDFAQFSADMIRPGAYRVGVACVRTDGAVDRYWDAIIDWAADGSWNLSAAAQATTNASSPATSAAPAPQGTAPGGSAAIDDASQSGADVEAATSSAGAAPTMRVAIVNGVAAPSSPPTWVFMVGLAAAVLRIAYLVLRARRGTALHPSGRTS